MTLAVAKGTTASPHSGRLRRANRGTFPADRQHLGTGTTVPPPGWPRLTIYRLQTPATPPRHSRPRTCDCRGFECSLHQTSSDVRLSSTKGRQRIGTRSADRRTGWSYPALTPNSPETPGSHWYQAG